MQDNTKLLALCRAKIANTGKLKKDLAKKCGLAPSYFSEMLWGDKEMSPEVLQRLIVELNINPSSELPLVEKLM